MSKRDAPDSDEEYDSRFLNSDGTPGSLSHSNSYGGSFGNSSSQGEKRKRVARACDNCRQKKVKCDGKQPCIHCTVYSYKCTYDQPNIRNKKVSGIPIPAQPIPLTHVTAAAAGSSRFIGNRLVPPDALKSSSSYSSLIPSQNLAKNLIQCQNLFNVLLPKLNLNCLDENQPLNLDFEKLQKAYSYVESRNSGKINLNEVCDVYGNGESPPSPSSSTSPTFKSPRSSLTYIDDGAYNREIKLIIPSKKVSLQLIYVTWYKACVLFRFYHRPSLLEEVDLLYSLDPSNYGDRQQKFLPFLYSLLACGSLFSKTSDGSSDINDNLEDDGFKYFLEARKLIDISNVGDIHSIQTIVMMIMYLQCSARLSTCYSYIGIALRSALKEGLHRNLSIFQHSKRKLDPIEVDTRKRLFYTIYKMDIYINSLLGLPRSINEDEFDQEFPVDLDDENITRDAYLHDKQKGALSSSACANHHTKLMFILSHIVKKLYPIKVKAATNITPDHIHSKVTELEIELKEWLSNLPQELKPTDPNDPNSTKDIPEKFIMANYYIHLAFLNCQIMLYRPFIHFISNGFSLQTSDPRSLIRGRNCIKVARMVVKLSNKMIDQNLLVGTYWFSMYTIFFSIACLVYYFHFANYGSPESSLPLDGSDRMGMNYAGILFDDDLNIDMIKKDIEIGKKVLDNLKNNSNASLRIYNILNALFEQLNRRTANSSRSRENSQKNHEERHAPDYQTENVQATFKNFNTMNEYQTDKDKLAYNSFNSIQEQKEPIELYQFEAPLADLSTDAETKTSQFINGASRPKSESKVTNRSSSRNEALSVAKSVSSDKETSDYSNHEHSAPKGLKRVDSTNSNDSEEVDYLPGVFDRLDAQIFGRLLPPYMLEKNAQKSSTSVDSLFGRQGSNDRINSNSGATSESPSDVQINQINFDNLDLSLLDENTNLDYLDPFNPVNENS